MLDPTLTEKLRKKLDLNEHLVWAGVPKPWAFTKSSFFLIFFGLFWCTIVSIVGGTFIYGLWFEESVDPDSLAMLPLLGKLGMTAFFIPFIIIGLWTLFNPLWLRIWSSNLLYAVTDKRAIRRGWLFAKSWRAAELDKPDRIDKRSGVTHLFFAFSSVSHNGHHEQTGFRNLPSHEADAAEAALRKLYASADPDDE